MRIIVIGGIGYVGRTLSNMLIDEHEVCIVDNLRCGEKRLDKMDLTKVRLDRADIRDLNKIKEIVTGFKPDVMIHLAAIHYIPECDKYPDLAVSTNVTGTVNLLSVCPENCRFVYASTAAVYEPHEGALDEDTTPIGPMDVYGLSKLHGEDYTKYYAKLRNFPAVVARLFNVIGSGETNPHVLPEIYAQLKSGTKTLKLGNLTPLRDYIDVSDAASGFFAAAVRGDVNNGEVITVNLGMNRQYTVEELLEKVKINTGVSFSVEKDMDRVRKVDRPSLLADNNRIKNIFGWKPDRDIDKTLKTMWDNPDLPESLTTKYKV